MNLVNPYILGGGGPTPAVVGQALIYTGNGGTQSITGASFSPDVVACKLRGGFSNWRWVDSVRGVGLSVSSNLTSAELTEATGVTSFDANGFSLGADTDYNDNGQPYLALIMQEVAGAFDIVTYTGTGSARTVNHNLGVVPELIIVRNRSGTANWAVYPGPLSSPETKFLQFHTNAAVGTSSTVWNNTAPTSSVFTVATSSSVNTSGHNYVAYLFASLNPGVKVGSYTGNGGTNGPVVTTGFRPKFVLIKRTDAVGFWYLFDDQRDVSSPHNTYNSPASNDPELIVTNSAGGGVDFLPTGFQTIDVSPVPINESGATYIYLAIA